MEQQTDPRTRKLVMSPYGLLMTGIQALFMYEDLSWAENSYNGCVSAVISETVIEEGLNLAWLVSLTIDLFIISAAVHAMLIWLLRRPLANGRKWAQLSTTNILFALVFFQFATWVMILGPSTYLEFVPPYTYTRATWVIQRFIMLGWILGALWTKLVGLYLVPLLRNSVILWGTATIDSKYVQVMKRAQLFDRHRGGHAVQQESG